MVRYHVASLVAVLLALGAGVLLGAGTLDGESSSLETRTQDAGVRALRAEVSDLERRVAVGDDFAEDVRGMLTAERLDGTTAVVLALPGVDGAAVDAGVRALRSAGATVSGTVRLTDTYTDPEKARMPLEDLVLRLVPPGVEFPDGASAIERVGTVVARATVTRDSEETSSVDQPSAEVLAGLEAIGALDVTGEAGRRAEVAVVLAPPASADRGSAEDAAGRQEAVLGLVAALDAGSSGTVVTGPPSSASAGGVLAQLRRGGGDRRTAGASTVDLAGSTLGRIGLVLAVAEQQRGGSGHYGAGQGSQGVVPDVPAASTPGPTPTG